jgi:hypothetical protein
MLNFINSTLSALAHVGHLFLDGSAQSRQSVDRSSAARCHHLKSDTKGILPDCRQNALKQGHVCKLGAEAYMMQEHRLGDPKY